MERDSRRRQLITKEGQMGGQKEKEKGRGREGLWKEIFTPLPLPESQHAEPAYDEFAAAWDSALAEAKASGTKPKLMKVGRPRGSARRKRRHWAAAGCPRR